MTDDPILLIGGSGMLGRAWRQFLDESARPYEAPPSSICNLRSADSLRAAVRPGLVAVINCAAATDVDGCEANGDEANLINGIGVGVLAQRCAELNVPLVHYSTDYVFDGQCSSPYLVPMQRRPLNAYGRSKALGEELIEQARGPHLILRTSWLYAAWGKNFVLTIARLATERPTLRVVDDQRGRPTACNDLVSASWQLLHGGCRGLYHVSNDGECTWFELAAEIVRLRGSACQVHPCTTAEFPRPARRPAYSVLDLSQTIAAIGPLPHWRESLSQTISCLEPAAV